MAPGDLGEGCLQKNTTPPICYIVHHMEMDSRSHDYNNDNRQHSHKQKRWSVDWQPSVGQKHARTDALLVARLHLCDGLHEEGPSALLASLQPNLADLLHFLLYTNASLSLRHVGIFIVLELDEVAKTVPGHEGQ